MQNRIRATLAAAALAIATFAPIAAPVVAAVAIAAPAPAQASVVLAERAKPSPLKDFWAIIMSIVLAE